MDAASMRRLPLHFFLILLLPYVPPCWAGGSSEAAGQFTGQSGGTSSSTDTTWSNGLKSGVNGPIPVIVVDQFGYPTTASKVAVIRDPKVGYDNAAHFTPGAAYALVNQS